MGHRWLCVASRAIGLGLLLLSSGLATAADSAPSFAEARLLAGTEAQAVSSYGDPCKVHVFFTARLRPPSAENPANFTISPDIAVTAAAYDRQLHVVTLTVSPGLAEGVGYTLSVQGLLDAVGRPVPAVALPLDFAPIPADGLVFWLRSDRRILADSAGNVLGWGDASAGRNDLSALPDHAPTLRAGDGDTPAAVIFSGSTDRLLAGMTRELNTDALTWCIVFQSDDASCPQVLLRNAYAAGAWLQSRDLWGVKLDAGTATSHVRGRRGAEFATGAPIINADAWSIFTTVWDAPALAAWLDGAPTAAVSGADANPKAHRWLALGGGDESDSGFAGAVAEVIVYSRALSEAERMAMENYLAGKYPSGPDTFTVTFDLDGKGTWTGGGELIQSVEDGAAAIAPEVSGNAGWAFTGWDVAFDSIASDLTVTAQYVVTHTLIYTAGLNGSITGTTQQTVNHGASGTEVVAVADTGCHFVRWSDDVMTAARTDANVTADIAVGAEFAMNLYTVTFQTDGTPATLTGTTPQTIAHGSDCTAVTANAALGYAFVRWSRGGVEYSTNPTITPTNVTEDMTFVAEYDPIYHSVTFTAGANGSLSGSLSQSVLDGHDATPVAAVPDAGHLLIWSGDHVGAENPLTLTNVTADMDVTANFDPDPGSLELEISWPSENEVIR